MTAWMTFVIFDQWLSSANKELFRAHPQKIFTLLLDNAPSHIDPKKYSNIQLSALPKNTTAHL